MNVQVPNLLLRPGSVRVLLVHAEIILSIRAESDLLAIRTPDRELIVPGAESETRHRIVGQLMNPNVYSASVRVRLVSSNAPPVWRDAQVAEIACRSDGTNGPPAPVKPFQLRLGCAFSGLCDQSPVAGHAEESKVYLRHVLDLVADGMRLSA